MNFDDGDRQVGLPEFIQGMRRYLGTTNDDAVLAKVFEHIDSNGNGSISIDEFLQIIVPIFEDSAETADHPELETLDCTVGGEPLTARQLELIRNVRSIFIDRHATTGRAVHKVLQNFDDGNGLIEYPEFRNGVYSYMGATCDIEEQDLEEVFGFFDVDGGGAISIDEFLIALMRPLPLAPLAGDGRAVKPARKRTSFAPAPPSDAKQKSNNKRFARLKPAGRSDHYVPFYGISPARHLPNPCISNRGSSVYPNFSDIPNNSDRYKAPAARNGVMRPFNVRNASPRMRQTLEERSTSYFCRESSQLAKPATSSPLKSAVTPRCPMTARSAIDCNNLLVSANRYTSSSQRVHTSPVLCKLQLSGYTPRPPVDKQDSFRMVPMVSSSHAAHRDFRITGAYTARAS